MVETQEYGDSQGHLRSHVEVRDSRKKVTSKQKPKDD